MISVEFSVYGDINAPKAARMLLETVTPVIVQSVKGQQVVTAKITAYVAIGEISDFMAQMGRLGFNLKKGEIVNADNENVEQMGMRLELEKSRRIGGEND